MQLDPKFCFLKAKRIQAYGNSDTALVMSSVMRGFIMLITEKAETGVADVDCLFAQRQGLTRSDNNNAETYEGH